VTHLVGQRVGTPIVFFDLLEGCLEDRDRVGLRLLVFQPSRDGLVQVETRRAYEEQVDVVAELVEDPSEIRVPAKFSRAATPAFDALAGAPTLGQAETRVAVVAA
jgi:hypothetical protein